VLLAYPLAMTFTLVYSGEHYVIDVLVGWAYVAAVFLLVGAAERWWRERHPRAVN
jgi:membrane-associated phospholipid phosphatase